MIFWGVSHRKIQIQSKSTYEKFVKKSRHISPYFVQVKCKFMVKKYNLRYTFREKRNHARRFECATYVLLISLSLHSWKVNRRNYIHFCGHHEESFELKVNCTIYRGDTNFQIVFLQPDNVWIMRKHHLKIYGGSELRTWQL